MSGISICKIVAENLGRDYEKVKRTLHKVDKARLSSPPSYPPPPPPPGATSPPPVPKRLSKQESLKRNFSNAISQACVVMAFFAIGMLIGNKIDKPIFDGSPHY